MLLINLTLMGLLITHPGPGRPAEGPLAPALDELFSIADAGYFFALEEVPLSQKQYIFTADPLKRAVYFEEGKRIPLSHTMTMKNARGFDMYFSGDEYQIILSVKQEKIIDEITSQYLADLIVRHGQHKRRYALHGIISK